MTFMLPTSFCPRYVFIVVVAGVPPQTDILQGCLIAGICAATWAHCEAAGPQILFCSTPQVIQNNSLVFVKSKQRFGVLGAFYFEKEYLMVLVVPFRLCLRKMQGYIRPQGVNVSFFAVIDTYSPERMDKVYINWGMGRKIHTHFRAEMSRANICYGVELIDEDIGDFLGAMALVRDNGRTLTTTSCSTVKQAHAIINCKLKTPARIRSFNVGTHRPNVFLAVGVPRWYFIVGQECCKQPVNEYKNVFLGGSKICMVNCVRVTAATAAFACSAAVPEDRLVLHVELPYS